MFPEFPKAVDDLCFVHKLKSENWDLFMIHQLSE